MYCADSPTMTTEDAVRESLMANETLLPDQRARFMTLFNLYTKQKGKKNISLEMFQPLQENNYVKRESISACPSDDPLRRELLDKMAVVKLNGGLGSTMGCDSIPKSAIEVRNGLSFLDLGVRQIEYLNSLYGMDIPLILMNSFKTHQVTQKCIRKYRSHNLTIHTILQNCFPRISKATLLPIPQGPFNDTPSDEWYPPGHGDIYYSLWSSGVLDSLLHDGKEYAFISNIDNLTATIDIDMLYYLYLNDVEMCMEVTPPNKTDNDGGYYVKKVNSEEKRFIEINEVAIEDREEFKRNFHHFNTNNLWVDLRALKRQIEAGDYGDTVIAQERALDNGMKVIQLETTAGSLINKMKNTLAVAVERRKRYVPVKTTADLMLIQSDIFSIRHGALLINPSLMSSPLPTIKLGKEFTDVDDFVRRIPIHQQYTANIAELEHLTIAGDVYIGKNVTLKGTVIIIAVDGSVIMIPDGSSLVDKVVTGNLRILDH